ncbi:MAG: histone deacetylase, partial [Calditrichaeota bacterium]
MKSEKSSLLRPSGRSRFKLLWRLRPRRVPIVYHPEVLGSVCARQSRQSFDPYKFKKIRTRLVREKLVSPKHLLHPEPASEEDLLRVHTHTYLARLKNPQVVAQLLHLDYVDLWDNYVLRYFRSMCGGTLLAAEQALATGRVGFHLGGGYHHAFPDRGGGYCLLNDVAVAIRSLFARQWVQRVLIVDLDAHQGDGLLEIFSQDPRVFHFDIHADSWITVEKKEQKCIALSHDTGDEGYLSVLSGELPGVFASFRPELVFYLAGSDPYQKDPLGPLALSEAGLLARDRMVFE